MKYPAFWISPTGEILYVQTTHINEVIKKPMKFGLNRKMIDDMYDFHKEKMGVEGVARRKILIALINKNWIRIRKYKDQNWSINVKTLTDRTKTYLSKWAQQLLKGCNGFQEQDPYILVKIDQKNKARQIFNISTIAESNEFRTGDYQAYQIMFKRIDELEDLPLIEAINNILPKQQENMNSET